MNTTTSFQDLGKKIEQVIQEHIAASHRAAALALEQAFASAMGTSTRTPRTLRSCATGRRRLPGELSAISEQLYGAVCAKPGEAMAVLAADVGATPSELNRPMAHLKRAGRVRSVGQRNFTRYFPLMSKTTVSP